MTKEEAAAALANGQNGAFVVRERATEANEYGLSVQCKVGLLVNPLRVALFFWLLLWETILIRFYCSVNVP